MRNITTGALKLNDIVVTDVNLSDYLPLSGGMLTGDLSVKNADVSILSGKFSGGENATAIGKSAFAYGDSVSAIGGNSYAIGKNSVAGCYGWYYDHIDFANNTFYLTKNQPQVIHTSSLTGAGTIDTAFNSGFEVGDVISYVNRSKFDIALSVVAVNGNQISVEPFKNTTQYTLDETTPNHDDWTIFCPGKPLVGEIWLGEAAYADGLCCHAINAYSHAEGRQNFAYGQYSHVEGYKNRAAYAAHAEGKETYADAFTAHAEGYMTTAKGTKSHAEGYNTIATGEGAHAEGNYTSAYGNYSHAQGSNTLANGNNAFAGGYRAKAYGPHSIAFGNNSYTSEEAYSGMAFGGEVSAINTNAFACGRYALAKDDRSFVWNSKNEYIHNAYESNGVGTFNINPDDGINGVYIGLSSLADYLHNASSLWNGKTILFYGDSITEPANGYVNLACSTLGAKSINRAVGAATFALSSSGHTSARTRESLVKWVDEQQPADCDAVFVNLGTNDWMYSWSEFGQFGDTSLDTFYGALDYSCKKLLDKYAGKPIIFATPLKRCSTISSLSDIPASIGWIKQDGTLTSNNVYEYKIIPIPQPNSTIEISATTYSKTACSTWYTFLSSEMHTTGYSGMYAPTSPISQWSPSQNEITNSTSKTFTSPPVPSYLWISYSRNDDTTQYGSDKGNAWPSSIKINNAEINAIPHGKYYSTPNMKAKTLEDYANAIKQVCAYYGIKVLDLYSECSINPLISSHYNLMIPDGTHPSINGHKLLAKYVAGAFNGIAC